MSDVGLDNTIATGQQRSASKIQQNFERLRDFINGDGWIDSSKYGDGSITSDKLAGVKAVGGGKSVTATEQTRNSTSYGPLSGTLGTDATDEVRGIVLPADGLLVVAFDAMVKSSVGGAGSVAIHLNNTLVSRRFGTGTQGAAVTTSAGAANQYDEVTTSGDTGLSIGTATGGAMSPLTTGWVLTSGAASGGPCYIFAAAGTYNVSIQFKATSGTITAKERKLWVMAMGY